MVSISETTAVSWRKGDRTSNEAFTGVIGEITVDLGDEINGVLGVDTKATLRLHNGITKGGIPLCRADTRNISTQVLAENRQFFNDKNLAYADLSNLELMQEPENIDTLVEIFTSYGIVDEDKLKEETDKLALKDMSNVITSTLASGRGRGVDGNLAYADTSNINTKDLTDVAIHDGKTEGDNPLAYANGSNIDTTYFSKDPEDRPDTVLGPTLALKDFSNIEKETWQGTLFDPSLELNLQVTTNLDTEIPEGTGGTSALHYPSTPAVQEYVTNEIEKRNYLQTDLNNILKEGFELLASNEESKYRYLFNSENIIDPGYGFFTSGELYPNPKYFATNIILTHIDEEATQAQGEGTPAIVVPDTVKAHILITETELLDPSDITSGKPVKGTVFPVYTDTPMPERLVFNSNISDTFYVNISSKLIAETGLYYNELTSFEDDDSKYGNYYEDEILYPLDVLTYPKRLCIKVTGTEQQTPAELTSFEFYPNVGNMDLLNTEITVYPGWDNTSATSGDTSAYKNAIVKVNQNSIYSTAGGGYFLKSDLSNLRGMDEELKSWVEDCPWKIKFSEDIASLTEKAVQSGSWHIATEYTKLASLGAVQNAVINNREYTRQLGGIPSWEASKSYIITPDVSKVLYNGDIWYCKEAHTSGSTFDATKWTRVSDTTYEHAINKDDNMSLDPTNTVKFPTNSAVAKYVKEQIDAVHLPGHYQGQVNIMVPTEAELPPATSTEYPNLQPTEGLTALISNYTVSNKPAIATYTNNAWTYEVLTLQNGVYVYILNLGGSYDNGPGTATWNIEGNKFDIAPDKFQVPDGITLNLNESTGAMQIVPALQQKLEYVDVSGSIQTTINDLYSKIAELNDGLDAMIIPTPQFFTGTGIVGQTLVISDDVAFDLYVNGQFQYPNTYTYEAISKTITLNFVVENTVENGIAVIYRGFRTLKKA